MNASPVPINSTSRRAETRAKTGRSMIFTITGVCFLFGCLLAVQLRAIQSVHAQQEQEKARLVQEKELSAEMKAKVAESEKEREELQDRLKSLTATLTSAKTLSQKEKQALSAQIKELQTVAGLTAVSGPGVRIVLSDNAEVANAGDPSMPLPGIVHDYDLLQVVNEIRAAKADAIAIRGAGQQTVRITGFTPIRCVGPTIYVNWEPLAAPFTIEAIGDPKTLRSALEMPAGIVDNLKGQGGIGVKVASVDKLELPAATGGAPKLRVAS